MPSNRAVALAYHGVGDHSADTDAHRLVVHPKHLESQLRLLIRLGYDFCLARDLVDRPLGAGEAVLTFDDGFQGWVDLAAPLLARLGLPASFYVCTDWLGGQHPLVSGPAGRLLDRAGIESLLEGGHEVGSHTRTHPDLRTLDDAALESEVLGSRRDLEALTGVPCVSFAHPFGLHDERVRAAVEAAGYGMGWDWLPADSWSPFAAPRMPAPCRHGAVRLALKLRGLRRRWRR